ncbi:Hypothetical protein SMAX5B_016884 [Scophthalmus maximus]|uniref:Uncharacterized protein n=1 Tax=Scophthalmus maximus TaxID=52904 RepID=A0A2U9CH15_SCOMX|nr:Hypothetical protein SMAX5B_016884 [Scophthalmus maximus]
MAAAIGHGGLQKEKQELRVTDRSEHSRMSSLYDCVTTPMSSWNLLDPRPLGGCSPLPHAPGTSTAAGANRGLSHEERSRAVSVEKAAERRAKRRDGRGVLPCDATEARRTVPVCYGSSRYSRTGPDVTTPVRGERESTHRDTVSWSHGEKHGSACKQATLADDPGECRGRARCSRRGITRKEVNGRSRSGRSRPALVLRRAGRRPMLFSGRLGATLVAETKQQGANGSLLHPGNTEAFVRAPRVQAALCFARVSAPSRPLFCSPDLATAPTVTADVTLAAKPPSSRRRFARFARDDRRAAAREVVLPVVVAC